MLLYKKKEYSKAFVELYEIIKLMPKNERKKIPDNIITNLKNNMDKDYEFVINDEADIENNIKVETKALYLQIYIKYLSSNQEKEEWKKYNKICSSIIENEKKIEI